MNTFNCDSIYKNNNNFVKYQPNLENNLNTVKAWAICLENLFNELIYKRVSLSSPLDIGKENKMKLISYRNHISGL